jgi:hypothetical protein
MVNKMPDNKPKLGPKGKGIVMAAFALLGLGLASFVMYKLFNKGAIVEAVKNNPPWHLIAGIAAAPLLLLLWFWRDLHRTRDIENKENENAIRERELDLDALRRYEERSKNYHTSARAVFDRMRSGKLNIEQSIGELGRLYDIIVHWPEFSIDATERYFEYVQNFDLQDSFPELIRRHRDVIRELNKGHTKLYMYKCRIQVDTKRRREADIVGFPPPLNPEILYIIRDALVRPVFANQPILEFNIIEPNIPGLNEKLKQMQDGGGQ